MRRVEVLNDRSSGNNSVDFSCLLLLRVLILANIINCVPQVRLQEVEG